MLVCVGLAWFFEQQATTTIIFVRHTDTVAVAGGDPPLSRIGRQRAELLADVIQDIDVVAGIDAVYASDHRSTQETAASVAGRLELDVAIRDPYEVVPFMAQVLRQHKGEIVLVVTLGDALAPLVEELHGSKNIPAFGPDDYDDIYIVTIPWFGKVQDAAYALWVLCAIRLETAGGPFRFQRPSLTGDAESGALAVTRSPGGA